MDPTYRELMIKAETGFTAEVASRQEFLQEVFSSGSFDDFLRCLKGMYFTGLGAGMEYSLEIQKGAIDKGAHKG